MDIFTILRDAVNLGASDIHLVVGLPPMARITGQLIPLESFPALAAADTKNLVYALLYDEQKQHFEEHLELDCSHAIPNFARFRINVLLHNHGVGAVLRVIGSRVPTVEEIGLSQEMTALCHLPRGLVLVTGPTGSGKSTTLAAMIQQINMSYRHHILTIEDPVEFVYEPMYSVITQREVGRQTHTFTAALRSALRQDPDVILVGELRDLETISLALTAAETGHLVFGTLHTTDATQTIDRIVDVFPPYQQQQIRVQLGGVLKGVICQTLIPRADGQGRVAARELLVTTPAVANLIREGKTHQLYNVIDTGGRLGMISMDKALANLVREESITLEEALPKAHDAELIHRYLDGGTGARTSSSTSGWR
ncbi:MAG: type IV pilus twitching motility protein PilT [Proteobacteria bacterium]|nr:type IV pilus twitching motility protein PilT [Pseudomonadota bacterium]